ncbi:hypothetical protein HGRIS_006539 [Hohenbuehelia grisea]|uniref:Uncharacterized protein n=1 Tax=Hohenbuehelia grisea TaxID=104357 RepID=A0ABR3J9C4_9AGAR
MPMGPGMTMGPGGMPMPGGPPVIIAQPQRSRSSRSSSRSPAQPQPHAASADRSSTDSGNSAADDGSRLDVPTVAGWTTWSSDTYGRPWTADDAHSGSHDHSSFRLKISISIAFAVQRPSRTPQLSFGQAPTGSIVVPTAGTHASRCRFGRDLTRQASPIQIMPSFVWCVVAHAAGVEVQHGPRLRLRLK